MKIGKQTYALKNTPTLLECACIVGPKEGNGPLKDFFDLSVKD
ncbi:MAG: stage V sporulation protein AD, partial [Clostridia bacterium]